MPQGGQPLPALSDKEQIDIVSQCRGFKQSAISAAKEKKERLKTVYAYCKNKFVGNDLLPTPAVNNDNDASKQRPKCFIPLSKQQLKAIYCQIKMAILPNDEDYFRIRAKKAEGVQFEETLTEGLKYVFKQSQISEKLGQSLYNFSWSAMLASYPIASEKKTYATQYIPPQAIQNPETGEITEIPEDFEIVETNQPPRLDIINFNPLNLFIDPNETDLENIKWGYTVNKRILDFKDGAGYINQEKLDDLEIEQPTKNNDDIANTNDYTGMSDSFRDTPGFVKYDLYYFPYLNLKNSSGKEYRNMLIGVAADQVLVRFQPNTLPLGLNPLVYSTWSGTMPDDAYSMGPLEDLLELQKLINILYNYKIEVMARAGNRFIVRPNVDLSNFFGVAGGVAVADDPRGDMVSFTGDMSEIASLDNTIGVLKAEAQIVSGAQQPFQGSSQIDYKKTATEMQIVQEGSISVLREVIEHISVTGISRILERLMYIVADVYTEPLEIRVENNPKIVPDGQPQFVPVDFSMLKSGDFVIELVGSNPSQSKQAQVNGLMQMLQFVSQQPPEVTEILQPLIEKIGVLQGIKDVGDLMQQMKDRLDAIRQQTMVGAG